MRIITIILLMITILCPNYLLADTSNTNKSKRLGVTLSNEAIANLKALDILYMKSTKIKAQFTQKTNFGDTENGWFIIQKPGKARVEYDTSPIKIIVNSDTLLVHNTKDKTKSFLPIRSSPFYYLLQTDFSFFNKDLVIIDYVKKQYSTEIKFTSKDSPELGNINLVLNNKGEVMSWIVNDAKGIKTTITLVNPNFSTGTFKNKNAFNIHRITNITYSNLD